MSDADSAPGQPAQAAIRVPVWRVIAAGLRSVFLYPGNFARRAWPLVLVTSGVLAMRGARFGDLEQAVDDSLGAGLGMAAVALAALAVAVRWHRGLLAGEPPPGIAVLRPEMAWLRFAAAFVVVVVGTMLVGSLMVAALFGVVEIAADPNRALSVVWGLAAPVFIGMAMITGRLMVAYPLIALGGKTMESLRRSWRLTRGNTWRLVLMLALYTAMEWLLFPAVHVAFQAVENVLGVAGFALGVVADALMVAVFTALIASILSYIYAVLTGHPAAAELDRKA